MTQENQNTPEQPKEANQKSLKEEVFETSNSDLAKDVKNVEGIEDDELQKSKNYGQHRLEKNWIRIKVALHWVFLLVIIFFTFMLSYYLSELMQIYMKSVISTPESVEQFLIKIWDTVLIVLATLFIEQSVSKK